MKQQDDEISSAIQKTTSLLEVLAKARKTRKFTDDEKKILDDFYGEDGFGAKRIMALYWQAISEQSSTSNNGDEKSINQDNLINDDVSIFIENMTKIIGHLIWKVHFNSMREYSLINRRLLNNLKYRTLDLFRLNDLSNLPSEKNDYIQQLLSLWAGIPDSIDHISEFETFETAMKVKGTPLDNKVKYNYFLTYMKRHIDELGKNGVARDDILLEHEKHWLNEAFSNFHLRTIDDVWKDDTTNLFIQLLDKGMYRNSKIIQDNSPQISYMRKQFLKQIFFSKTNVDKADEYLDTIVKKYSTQRITNPQIIQDFYKAYQILYLKYLVSGNLKSNDTRSSDYARFIIRQMKSFIELGDEAKIDYKTLICRAIQETAIKDSHKEYQRRGFASQTGAITYISDDTEFSAKLGDATFYSEAHVISINSPQWQEKPKSLQLINTIDHEIGHTVSRRPVLTGENLNFESYMEYKTVLLSQYLNDIDDNNYENLFYEVRARLKGLIGQLKTFEKFPLTDSEEKKDKKRENLKNAMLPLFYDSVCNQLEIGGEYKPTVLLCDELLKGNIEKATLRSGYLVSEALFFEYKYNGHPKTFDEMFSNLESEMETGSLEPDMEPYDIESRSILRLQIMMSRAIACDKVEEFEQSINKFLKKHNEILIFDHMQTIFPEGKMPSRQQAEATFNKLFYEKDDMQLAELAYGVFTIADLLMIKKQGTNIVQKEAFRKDMFDSLYTQATKSNTTVSKSQPSPESQKHPDNKSNHDEGPIPD